MSNFSSWLEVVGLMYYIMTDRFGFVAHGDNANPMGFHGGCYATVRDAIVAGYFKKLGVRTLIISSPQLLKKAVEFEFGFLHYPYYGYLLENLFKPEPRFGSYQDLCDLIEVAHQNGLKVILDMCHHMHVEAGLVRRHPEFFAGDVGFEHLLKFDLGNAKAVRLLHASFECWITGTGADGARWDSMHHLLDRGHVDEMSPQEVAGNLTYLRGFFADFASPERFWSVGEVLDGYFDRWCAFATETQCPALYNYPLYYKLTRALACGLGVYVDEEGAWGDLNALADVVLQMVRRGVAERCLNFVDNHDMPRFLTLVYRTNGNNAPEPSGRRLKLALTVLFALPGIPSLFYGTEKGFSGEGWLDPNGSNRKTMPTDGPAPFAPHLLALATARETHVALRIGGYTELWRPHGGPQVWAFARVHDGKLPILTIVNNTVVQLPSGSYVGVPVDLGALPGGGISTQGILEPGQLENVLDSTQCPLRVSECGRLVGVVPPETALMVYRP